MSLWVFTKERALIDLEGGTRIQVRGNGENHSSKQPYLVVADIGGRPEVLAAFQNSGQADKWLEEMAQKIAIWDLVNSQ